MPKRKLHVVKKNVALATCRVETTTPFTCPLCLQQVAMNTVHECELKNGVLMSRNRPV